MEHVSLLQPQQNHEPETKAESNHSDSSKKNIAIECIHWYGLTHEIMIALNKEHIQWKLMTEPLMNHDDPHPLMSDTWDDFPSGSYWVSRLERIVALATDEKELSAARDILQKDAVHYTEGTETEHVFPERQIACLIECTVHRMSMLLHEVQQRQDLFRCIGIKYREKNGTLGVELDDLKFDRQELERRCIRPNRGQYEYIGLDSSTLAELDPQKIYYPM